MEKLRYSSTCFCPSLEMGREGVKQGVAVSWPGLFTCVPCSVAAVLCLHLTSLLQPSACFLEVVEKVAMAGGRFCVELLWFQLVSKAPSSSYRPSWAPHTASAGGFRRIPESFWIPGTRNATNNKGGVSHLGGSVARNLAQEGKRSLGAKSLFGVKMAPSRDPKMFLYHIPH